MTHADADKLLQKGLEEEVYAGTPDGRIVGLSHRVIELLPDFATEPDSRNIEYRTDPHRDYEVLISEFMGRRLLLRKTLTEMGGYTLIPGATMSLGDTGEFFLSDPDNPYYVYIRDTYGTDVVTASSHINIGVEDPEVLIRAYRLARCESALFLALTASSPFIDGQVTGYHSARWHRFPLTPPDVPMFENHGHFIQWVEKQFELGTMQNPRHLWLSVRPNGPASPHDLSRLELRICDRIADPAKLLALTALLEARVWQVIEDDQLDPFLRSEFTTEKLIELADANEQAAAKNSLDAQLQPWQGGRTIAARDWVAQLLEQVTPTAEAHGFAERLEPIHAICKKGNVAQQWMARYNRGESIDSIVRDSIQATAGYDQASRYAAC